MAVTLNIEMPECCDLCLFGCWSNLHQTAECYLMGDTQMFDDFSIEYKIRRSANCPMEEHKPKVERKKGKWKKLSSDTFHCRECGRTFIVIQGADYMNFCPNCGSFNGGAE